MGRECDIEGWKTEDGDDGEGEGPDSEAERKVDRQEGARDHLVTPCCIT